MTLIEKQWLFAKLLPRLLDKAHEMGYAVTLGECWRPEITAKKYQEMGIGIERSLHRQRLAIDLQLFWGKKYLSKTEDYQKLGEWWESQSTKDYECAWGGRFNDGCHFSISFGGLR